MINDFILDEVVQFAKVNPKRNVFVVCRGADAS